ncbi:MA2C1 mannosidase, partial [Sylvia borin]|nr:MA2C1 mannosidase [Sylvia borin]
AGSVQDGSVIQQAHNLNSPLHVVPASCAQCPAWSAPAMRAHLPSCWEDRAEALVVWLYEAHGSTVTAPLQTSLPPCALPPCCDLLEHLAAQGCLPLEPQGLRLCFTPIHVLSVLLVRSC